MENIEDFVRLPHRQSDTGIRHFETQDCHVGVAIASPIDLEHNAAFVGKLEAVANQVE